MSHEAKRISRNLLNGLFCQARRVHREIKKNLVAADVGKAEGCWTDWHCDRRETPPTMKTSSVGGGVPQGLHGSSVFFAVSVFRCYKCNCVAREPLQSD